MARQTDDDLAKNWYDAIEGLRFLEEGLVAFLDYHAKALHAEISDKVRRDTGQSHLSCNKCSIYTLLPWHTIKTSCPHTPLKSNKCYGCNTRFRTKRRHCPDKVCGRFYDYIVQDHQRNEPIWENTDASKWTSDYWQVAKCYMSTKGYKSHDSAEKTDVCGLLGICINSKTIRQHIGNIQKFEEAKDVRNTLMHKSGFKISEADLAHYLDTMVAVLRDNKALDKDKHAQHAIQKITAIKSGGMNNFAPRKQLSPLEHRLTPLRPRRRRINSEDLQREVQVVLEKYNTVNRILRRKEKLQDVQQCLIQRYQQQIRTTYESPLFPGKESIISRIRFPSKMTRKTDLRETDVGEEIREIWQIFKHNGQNQFPLVLLKAQQGFGKTTLLNHLLNIWITAIQDYNAQNSSTNDKTEAIKSLGEFTFTFYIPLNKVEKEETLVEMVMSQLRDKAYSNTIEDILRNEKCLLLFDELEEWTGRKMILKKIIYAIKHSHKQCCGIFTTRPRGIKALKLSHTEFDAIIELHGAKREDIPRCVQEVVKCYDMLDSRQSDSGEFIEFLLSNGMIEVQRHPILLKFAIRLWHKSGIKCNNLTDLIQHMIKTILQEYIPFDNHKDFVDDIGANDPSNRLLGAPRVHPRSENVIYNQIFHQLGHFSFNHLLSEPFQTEFKHSSASESLGGSVFRIAKYSRLIRPISVPGAPKSEFVQSQFQSYLAAKYLSMCSQKERLKYLDQLYHSADSLSPAIEDVFKFLGSLYQPVTGNILKLLQSEHGTNCHVVTNPSLAFQCLREAFMNNPCYSITPRFIIYTLIIESEMDIKYLNLIEISAIKHIRVLNIDLVSNRNVRDILFEVLSKLDVEKSDFTAKFIDVKISRSDINQVLSDYRYLKDICLQNIETISELSDTQPKILQMKFTSCEIINSSNVLDDIHSAPLLKDLRVFKQQTYFTVFRNMPVLRNLDLSQIKLSHTHMIRIMCKLDRLVSLKLKEIVTEADDACKCLAGEGKKIKKKPMKLETLVVENVPPKVFKHVSSAIHLTNLTFIAQKSLRPEMLKLPVFFESVEDLVQMNLSVVTLKNLLLTRNQVICLICNTVRLELLEMWNIVCPKVLGDRSNIEKSQSTVKHLTLHQTLPAEVTESKELQLFEEVVHVFKQIATFPHVESITLAGIDHQKGTEYILDLIRTSNKLGKLCFSNLSMSINWLLEMVVVYKNELEVVFNDVKPLDGLAIQPLKEWLSVEQIVPDEWDVNIADNTINIAFTKRERSNVREPKALAGRSLLRHGKTDCTDCCYFT